MHAHGVADVRAQDVRGRGQRGRKPGRPATCRFNHALLLLLWPRETGQPSDPWERFVVECKVLRDSDRRSLAATVERGVEQTLDYMAKCGAEEGHLVVIDRRGEDRRRGEGEPDGGGLRRQDGRGVVVWTL